MDAVGSAHHVTVRKRRDWNARLKSILLWMLNDDVTSWNFRSL